MKPEVLVDLLRSVMRDNPGASEREIHDVCKGRLDETARDALFEYWFGNSYRDFVVEQIAPGNIAVRAQSRRRNAPSDGERAQRRLQTDAAVSVMSAKLKVALMDHVLSTGILLRNATFGQCAAESGWLSSIAKHGKSNEIVGKKLTEIDLRNLRMRNLRAA